MSINVLRNVCSAKRCQRITRQGNMGIEIESITPGDGLTYPKDGQMAVIHYIGCLPNGTQFDSSRSRGVPFKFRVGKGDVMKGWDIGIKKMSIGEHAKLLCPAELAYGNRGYPGVIPPNSKLIFDIELLALE